MFSEVLSSDANESRRVLVVGIGNVLRRDDGFGPAVVRALESSGRLPARVHTAEMGIGGMSLVLELMEGYDVLLLVDAVDRGGKPGSLYILEPEVPDAEGIPALEAWEWSGETCMTLPSRALVMARAAGALPPIVRIIGCQPGETEDFSTELSRPVQKAVPLAIQAVLSILADLDGGPHG